MDLRDRVLIAAFVSGATLALLAHPSPANELQVGDVATGFKIHDATETLHDYCSRDTEGRLWLALPSGARFELVTSTSDPAIFNPGDGVFHPYDGAEVRAALASLDFPLARIRADVFLLPFPRRSGPESAAGAGLILLSPGVRPLSREQQHAEFIHELGHVVHRALMPDSSATTWGDYRSLRGITDAHVFAAAAAHANRPHEIFAEDFRALFGGALANYSGSIENASITRPSDVAGLKSFMLTLAGPHVEVSLGAQPNPSRGGVQFARPGSVTVMMDVFDAQGRRVVALAPLAVGGAVRWNWDGRNSNGLAMGAGVFYARPREVGAVAIRVTRLK